MSSRDTTLLRDLAKRYREICSDPIQDERRNLWRQHNSLKPSHPLIYVRAFALKENPAATCLCEDPILQRIERAIRQDLIRSTFNDDYVYEPWISINAVRKCTGWGIDGTLTHPEEPGGAFKVDYPIKKLEDIEKLRTPWHEIDETATAEHVSRVQDAVGDIITINVDRGPAYRMWSGDIATSLGFLRGIENVMLDMLDNPEWLHRLVKFMSDGILRTHEQAEAAGDWGLCAHQNQAIPYAEELEDPAANVNGVKRKQLWAYMAAQEITAVSPAMHDEFLLQYQIPILKHFGLTAYGCCEDLTNKIDMLRQIPNLRRIAVSPFADVAKCAEQIGSYYVISYRPSPADMVSYGFDEDRIRTILTRDIAACKGCHVDITLKDVETVQGDISRVKKWVDLTRKVVEEIW